MTSEPAAQTSPATASPMSARLARGVTATWWYTMLAVVFFEAMLLLIWVASLVIGGIHAAAVLAVAIGGTVWFLSTLVLLIDYRHRADHTLEIRSWRLLVPLAIALAFGALCIVLTGSWLLGLLPLAQSLTLLNWQQGVRLRLTIALTLALACMWIVDERVTFSDAGALGGSGEWIIPELYSVLLPLMSLTSLWWWDVLNTLDRARASEARLAATQERLRVATDVHDLQGHHLQVIALQLELAERLMPRDPDASLEQLRLARESVDAARQGTRDLALQFRSVPLTDELANASELLEAAGLTVETSVDPRADRAPAATLGPVIRETTTNILRHGAGRTARLALLDTGASWRYEVANDVEPGAEPSRDGSGLDGIRRRLDEVGGTLEVRHGDAEFTLIATVPHASGVAQ